MKQLALTLRSRPVLVGSALAGCAVAALLPSSMRAVTRGLVGWNAAVWLYLLHAAATMLRASHDRMRRVALAHAESAVAVAALVVVAAAASLVGIVMELAAAKTAGASHPLRQVLLALGTIAGAWLLVATVFTFTYASVYYAGGEAQAGLQFPDPDPAFRPHYIDFVYFSFTIAVACQTADVAVRHPALRRLVLMQSLTSFVFNTAILALAINIAAGMF